MGGDLFAKKADTSDQLVKAVDSVFDADPAVESGGVREAGLDLVECRVELNAERTVEVRSERHDSGIHSSLLQSLEQLGQPICDRVVKLGDARLDLGLDLVAKEAAGERLVMVAVGEVLTATWAERAENARGLGG